MFGSPSGSNMRRAVSFQDFRNVNQFDSSTKIPRNTSFTETPSAPLNFPPRVRQLLTAYFKNARNCLSITEYPDLTLVSVARGSNTERAVTYKRLVELQRSLRVATSPFPLGYETLFTALSRPVNQETGSSIFVLPGQVRLTSPSLPALCCAQAAVDHRAAQINNQTRSHVLFIHVPKDSPRRFKFEPHPSAPDDLCLISLPTTNSSSTPRDPIIYPGAHIHSFICFADLEDPQHMRIVLDKAFDLADEWDDHVINRSANAHSAVRQDRVTNGSVSLSSRMQHLMFYLRSDVHNYSTEPVFIDGLPVTKNFLLRNELSAESLVKLLQSRVLDYTIKHPYPHEFANLNQSNEQSRVDSRRIFGLGYVANVCRDGQRSESTTVDPSDRAFARVQHWFSLSPTVTSFRLEDAAVVLPCRPNVAIDLILPHSYGIGSLQLRFHFNTRLPNSDQMLELNSFVSSTHDTLRKVMSSAGANLLYMDGLGGSEHGEVGGGKTGRVALPPHALSSVFEGIMKNQSKIRYFNETPIENPNQKAIRIHKSMATSWKDLTSDWLLETRDVTICSDTGLYVIHASNTNSPDQRQETLLFTQNWDQDEDLSEEEFGKLSLFGAYGNSDFIATTMSTPARPFACSKRGVFSDKGLTTITTFVASIMNVLANHYEEKQKENGKRRGSVVPDQQVFQSDDDSFFAFNIG
ncbi:hypothetical protein RCL1_006555 [Eukaryota sp. TZLM3-RCL]